MRRKLLFLSAIFIAVTLMILMTGCFSSVVTISFDSQGAGRVPSVTVEAGTEMLELPSPIREGYLFNGWYYDAACEEPVNLYAIPDASVTFYAGWIIQTFIVTFDAGTVKEYVEIEYGGSLTLSQMPDVPERDGFVGRWNTEGLVNVKESLTVYAEYTPSVRSIVYMAGGTEYARFNGLPGDSVELPSTPDFGETYFGGWYYDEELTLRCDQLPREIGAVNAVFYASIFDLSNAYRYVRYESMTGGIRIVGLSALGMSQSEIAIPSVIDGQTVLAVGYEDAGNSRAEALAVFSSPALIRVVLPDTVKTVGVFAFYGSFALREVIIDGNSLESIGMGAFAGCKELVSFSVPDRVHTVGKYAFSGIMIGNGTLSFPADEGEWSKADGWQAVEMKLTSLTFSENSTLSNLREYAFYQTKSLKTLTLPNAITSVSYLMFTGSGLQQILFHEGNLALKSEGGVVYSKDGAYLYYYPEYAEGEYTVAEGTRYIADGAFRANLHITSLTVSDSLTQIGSYAFYGSALQVITFPTHSVLASVGAFAFANCVSLTKIFLPETLTSLGNSAFSGAVALNEAVFLGDRILLISQRAFEKTALTEFNLPTSVERIGEYAFYDCNKLFTFDFDIYESTLKYIDRYAFADCGEFYNVELPSGVLEIAEYAFAGVNRKLKLTLSQMPASLQRLGDYAFMNSGVVRVDFPSSITTLGVGAFQNCTSLKIITLVSASGISAIPEATFSGCTFLSEVIFPYQIVSIGKRAFYFCTSLVSVTFSGGSGTGRMASIGESAFENCTKLNSFGDNKRILPVTLTSLGARAFYGCTSLTTVAVPKGLSEIPSETFAECTALSSISYDLGGILSVIGRRAFSGCIGLSTAELPATLLSAAQGGLLENPFYDCDNLAGFTIPTNEKYIIREGVLYEKTGEHQGSPLYTLYLYPTGKTGFFTVGVDVIEIAPYAFCGARLSSLNFARNDNQTDGNQVQYEVISLVKIGAYAFYDSNIQSAVLSKRVYLIDTGAFAEARNLNTLTIESVYVEQYTGTPASLYFRVTNTDVLHNLLTVGQNAFYGTAVSELILPERLIDIKEGGFRDMHGLRTLTVLAGTYPLSVGEYAFYGASLLSALHIPSRTVSIGDYAFSFAVMLNTLTFAEGTVLSIGDYAFSNCHNLYELDFPASLSYLGEGAFSYTTRLKYVNFSDTSFTVGGLVLSDFLFYGSSTLTEITLPNYITRVGASAFRGSNLRGVTLSDGGLGLSIGDYAFADTPHLKTIILPDRLIEIGAYAFYRSALESISYENTGEDFTVGQAAFRQSALKSVELNDRIVALGTYVFADTAQLTTVVISGSLQTLPDYAFYRSVVNSLTLGTVTAIGAYAFSETQAFTALVSTALADIGAYAFYLSGLKTVSLQSNAALRIQQYAFSNTALTSAVIDAADGGVEEFAFSNNSFLTTLQLTGRFSVLGTGFAAENAVLPEITVNDADGKYYAHNGVVYHDEAGVITLLQYPAGRVGASFEVDAAVTAVADYAFAGNKNLTSVILLSTTLVGKGEDSFKNVNADLDYYVPAALVPSYVNAWGVENIGYRYVELDGLVLKWLFEDEYILERYTGSATEVTVNGLVSFVEGGETVTARIVKIGDNAFVNNYTLQKLSIGTGIEEIGKNAFRNNQKLVEVDVGDSVTFIEEGAFRDNPALSILVIGESVRSIGDYAFYGATALTNLTLPANVKSLGKYCFAENTALTTVTLSEGLTVLSDSMFRGVSSLTRITIPSSVTSIQYNVFAESEKLMFITLLGKAPVLSGSGAFYGTSDSLRFLVDDSLLSSYLSAKIWREFSSRIFPVGGIVTEAGFENYILEQIQGGSYRLVGYLGEEETVVLNSTIPGLGTVTEIGSYAFNGFVKHLRIGEGVLQLSENALRGAVNLVSVVLPCSLVSIGNSAFRDLKALNSVTFRTPIEAGVGASSLATIGSYAFHNATALTAFSFPSRVSAIGSYAFTGDAGMNLSTVTFEMTAEIGVSIGRYAFAGNRGIRELIFNCKVTSIGAGAFKDCVGLSHIYFNAIVSGADAAVTEAGATDTFLNCNNLTVFVPNSTSLNAYSSRWSYLSDREKLVDVTYLSTAVDSQDFVIAPIDGSNSIAAIVRYIGTQTEITIPSVVRIRENNYIIRRINSYAIGSQVTKIVIPNTVESIQISAFRGAKNLSSVIFASGSALSNIGNYAFSDCDALATIEIPKTVRTIGEYAFYGCERLTSVIFEEIAAYDQPGELSLGAYAFSQCPALITMAVPKHLTALGESIFRGNGKFTSLIIPSDGKLAVVGAYAFYQTGLVSINLPASVASVQTYAFAECTALRSITLNRVIGAEHSSITVAASNVFGSTAGTAAMTNPFVKVYVPLSDYTAYTANDNNWRTKTVIPVQSADGFNYIVTGTTNRTVTITNYLGASDILTIPATITVGGLSHQVTAIGAYIGNEFIKKVVFAAGSHVITLEAYAFASCTSLTEIHLPDSVQYMKENVFADCTSLTDIRLSSELTDISAYTFSGCTSLTEITIPSKVYTFGDAAFANCTALNRIIIQFTQANALGSNLFYNVSEHMKLIVPAGRDAAFINNWTAQAGRIHSIDNLYGDYILVENDTGFTLVQYNGYMTEFDFTALTIEGRKITAIGNRAFANGTVTVKVDDTVARNQSNNENVIYEVSP